MDIPRDGRLKNKESGMKIIGKCTDKEAMKIIKDQYAKKTSKSFLYLLTGRDFADFLKKYSEIYNF